MNRMPLLAPMPSAGAGGDDNGNRRGPPPAAADGDHDYDLPPFRPLPPRRNRVSFPATRPPALVAQGRGLIEPVVRGGRTTLRHPQREVADLGLTELLSVGFLGGHLGGDDDIQLGEQAPRQVLPAEDAGIDLVRLRSSFTTALGAVFAVAIALARAEDANNGEEEVNDEEAEDVAGEGVEAINDEMAVEVFGEDVEAVSDDAAVDVDGEGLEAVSDEAVVDVADEGVDAEDAGIDLVRLRSFFATALGVAFAVAVALARVEDANNGGEAVNDEKAEDVAGEGVEAINDEMAVGFVGEDVEAVSDDAAVDFADEGVDAEAAVDVAAAPGHDQPAPGQAPPSPPTSEKPSPPPQQLPGAAAAAHGKAIIGNPAVSSSSSPLAPAAAPTTPTLPTTGAASAPPSSSSSSSPSSH